MDQLLIRCKIHFVECPTLVLATIDDHFVPIKHSKVRHQHKTELGLTLSQKLAKYVPSLFKFIELSNVHHDDILDDNSSLDAILDLLEQLDPGSTSSLVLAPVPSMLSTLLGRGVRVDGRGRDGSTM